MPPVPSSWAARTWRAVAMRRHLFHAPAVQLRALGHAVRTGSRVECPVCNARPRYFRPFGAVSRPNALCPSCFSLERHRVLWLFLREQTDFFRAPQRVLHLAPEDCLEPRLRALSSLDYVTADRDSPLADVRVDIQSMDLPDASFDVVLCSHVLEHVPDDRRALAEFHRVLRPGGLAVLMVPVWNDAAVTLEDPAIQSPADRLRHYGDADHVRLYGLDLADRVRDAGFSSRVIDFAREVGPERYARFGLAREYVFVGEKPAVASASPTV